MEPMKVIGRNSFHDIRLDIDPNSDNSMYMESALDVIRFLAVYDELEVRSFSLDTAPFKPDMAHQIFGENEIIEGYYRLSIQIKYLHNSCRCYVGINYARKNTTGVHQPDNILEKLNNALPQNYVTDIDAFAAMFAEEDHGHMFGTTINEFRDNRPMARFPKNKMYADYKVNKCELTEDFIQFHERFETYIMWFIDAASYIDLHENHWTMYYIYEEFYHPIVGKMYRSPIGYCSVYRFYHYPDTYRARISQVFILPTHQKRGIGKRLYQAVYKDLDEDPQIKDITVEEPSPVFQSLRCYVDAAKFYQELRQQHISICDRTQKHVKLTLRNSKLSKIQQQRVLDILNCLDEYRRDQNYDCIKDAILARFISIAQRSGYRKKIALREVMNKGEALQAKIEDAKAEYETYICELEPVIARLVNNVLGK